MVDGLAVAREPRRAVQQAAGAHRGPRGRAELRQVAQALVARAARRRPGERDVVARRRRAGRPRRPPRRRPRPRGRAPPGSASRRCRRSRSGRSGRRRSRAGARAPRPAPAVRARARHLERPAGALQDCGADLHACITLSSSSGMWQRIRWPSSTSTSGGSVSSQIAPSLRGQRVWKTQPDGGAAALGMSPSSLIRSRPPPSIGRHRREQRLGVRVVRPVEDDLGRAELHQPAQVEHGDPVGEVAHDAEVVRDEEVRDAASPPAARRAG